ncbi:MAG: universal stress protein [Acetobacteraceae bacterium]|nr:universal stress protein [Acetobacteraceae bacterium]
MSSIVALIDGSVYSTSVCDHAAWAAARIGAPVELLHVLGRRLATGTAPDLSAHLDAEAGARLLEELAAHDEAAGKLAQRRARAILDAARARMVEDGVGDITTRLRQGDLVETLHEMEAGTALVVIGKRGEAADFAQLHLGSNLERILRASRRPVLVAARAFRPIARVLLAFDGGPSAMKAVAHIAEGRLLHGLALRLLLVGTPSAQAATRLAEATATLRARGFAVTADTLPGQAEEVIAEAVRQGAADLLVMGAYGRSRIRTLIIGSTTTAMIRSCLIPVLLFR